MEEDQDYYEWILTPKNASEENKSGVTFKGRDTEYFNAHGKIIALFKKRGEKFIINGIELFIADKQKNKPINFDIKSKKGFTGKVNLKIYDKNNRGAATMLITKPSGGDVAHCRILAFDVIKFLLDEIISGNITDEHMAGFRVKTANKESKNNCIICEKVFTTELRLKLHTSKIHKMEENKCEVCGDVFPAEVELGEHKKSKHSNQISPEAKKMRISKEVSDNPENESDMDVDDQVEEKEKLSRLHDKKVLEKQKSIEKEVKLMEQMRKRNASIKEEQEKKRKRQMSVEKKKQKKKNKKENSLRKEKNKVVEIECNTDKDDLGPGYLGNTNDDEKEATILSYDELCQAYVNLSQDYKVLKDKYDKLNNTKDEDDVKDIRKLTREIKTLKDEYKECLEALKKETHDKVKAETTTKVLKNIISTQDEILEKKKVEYEGDNEEMEIDDALGEWIQQQKRTSLRFKKSQSKCLKCGEKFPNLQTLKTHEDTHRNSTYCDICDEIFVSKEDFVKHQNKHKKKDTHKCEVCEKMFDAQRELDLHVNTHAENHTTVQKEEQKYKCSKCEKEYTDMSELRRHDWRCHRIVPCSICGEDLQSRQYISDHRQKKHGINRTAVCKFYPNCLDKEECFFLHKEGNKNDEQQSIKVCPNGENCQDQACSFSEWNHKTSKVLCKFQQNCNRINCPFKDIEQRKAFLGVNVSNSKEK